MNDCQDCGAGNAASARFCSNCGHALERAPIVRRSRDLTLAEVLLLMGSVLGLVYIALFVIAWATLPRGDVIDRGDVRFVGFTPYFTNDAFATALLILWCLAVAGAFYARSLLATAQAENAAIVATVSGIVLIASGPWLAGLLVVAGAVLAWLLLRSSAAPERRELRPPA